MQSGIVQGLIIRISVRSAIILLSTYLRAHDRALWVECSWFVADLSSLVFADSTWYSHAKRDLQQPIPNYGLLDLWTGSFWVHWTRVLCYWVIGDCVVCLVVLFGVKKLLQVFSCIMHKFVQTLDLRLKFGKCNLQFEIQLKFFVHLMSFDLVKLIKIFMCVSLESRSGWPGASSAIGVALNRAKHSANNTDTDFLSKDHDHECV
jgi:hypothetical protein